MANDLMKLTIELHYNRHDLGLMEGRKISEDEFKDAVEARIIEDLIGAYQSNGLEGIAQITIL